MIQSIETWLLDYPGVGSMSLLARDACVSGLLDLREAAARAIARGIRTSAAGIVFSHPPGYHARMARMLSSRRTGLRLQLVHDTLVLSGSLEHQVGISADHLRSYIHIRKVIPKAMAAAMAGRPLIQIIDPRTLPLGRYTVADVEQDESGIVLRFDVPRVGLTEVLASCG